jgi:hypothetical protein
VGGAAELPPRAELDASAGAGVRWAPPREHAPGLPAVDDVVPVARVPGFGAAERRQDDHGAAQGCHRQHAPQPHSRACFPGTQPPHPALHAGTRVLAVPTLPAVQDAFFEGCVHAAAFKRMLFGLVFFHAVVQERRKFGPLGWNIPYGFDDGDWRISVRQLRKFIDDAGPAGALPFAALQYVTGECNYGGRVTDDKDRRLLNALLAKVYSPALVATDSYALSEARTFKTDWAAHNTRAEMSEYLAALPAHPAPEVFGLHANADISKDQNDTAALFASLLKCGAGGGGGAGGAGDAESLVAATVKQCLASLPPDYDTEAVQRKFPVMYEESMNTVRRCVQRRLARALCWMPCCLRKCSWASWRGLPAFGGRQQAGCVNWSWWQAIGLLERACL